MSMQIYSRNNLTAKIKNDILNKSRKERIDAKYYIRKKKTRKSGGFKGFVVMASSLVKQLFFLCF